MELSTKVEDVDHGALKQINVRTGRHVDFVEFVFSAGYTKSYGQRQGGSPCEPFVLNPKEYVVRVQGRQNKHLDAVQFVTNLGRASRWYGGKGGEAFQKRANAKTMVVGLVTGKGEFCPPVKGLELHDAPEPPPRIGMLRLLLHRNVRKLVFGGDPSLFKTSRQGSPSALRLMFRNRMIMIRVMFRGKPCFIRLLLDGEQSSEPSSLFRQLCTPRTEGAFSAMQMLTSRDKTDKKARSLAQLLLMGNPSVARQFFGKSTSKFTPLVQMLFEGDQVNGYPSITYLLTQRDTFDGVEFPSVFEAALEGEQHMLEARRKRKAKAKAKLKVDDSEGFDPADESEEELGPPMSLMRLMLLDKDGPSLFGLLMEGEREGKESILRRMVTDKHNNGLSMARMVLTPFENHKGHRPALSTYLFGGEGTGRASILRLLVAGEARANQLSIMRLLFYRFKRTKPGLFRSASSFRRRAERGNGPKERRSLVDLLTAGEPSISDLFFQGELEGEDSLARLVLGTSVEIKDGVLKLGGTLKQGNTSGVSLMQIMLIGEEDGGPGISFLRLFLFGEQENGFSILRLMLMNENTNEPSLLRLLLTSMKTALVAAKTRPSQFKNGEWKKQIEKISTAIKSSQKEGGSLQSQFNRIAQSFTANGEQAKALLKVLSTIPKRGKEFQGLWKKQWLIVAREIELAGNRAKKGTMWSRMAPTWKTMAEHLAHQRWTPLLTELALIASAMNGVSKWVKRIQTVQSATPFWMFKPKTSKSYKPVEEDSDEEQD